MGTRQARCTLRSSGAAAPRSVEYRGEPQREIGQSHPSRPEDADHEQEADLSETLVQNAHRKSMAEIAREIREGAKEVRKHEDPLLEQTKKLFDVVPPVVMRPLLRLVARLQYDFNIDLSAVGILNDPFGSAIITTANTTSCGFRSEAAFGGARLPGSSAWRYVRG